MKNHHFQKARKQFMKDTQLFNKERCISMPLSSFYTKLGSRQYLSENGFCVLIANGTDQQQYVDHWANYRYHC